MTTFVCGKYIQGEDWGINLHTHTHSHTHAHTHTNTHTHTHTHSHTDPPVCGREYSFPAAGVGLQIKVTSAGHYLSRAAAMVCRYYTCCLHIIALGWSHAQDSHTHTTGRTQPRTNTHTHTHAHTEARYTHT